MHGLDRSIRAGGVLLDRGCRGAVELGSFSLEGLAKNLESSGDKGAEVSAAVGYTREIAGIEMTARALVKHQPGIDTPGFDSTALELKADFAGDVGPAKATLGFTYSPDDTGSGMLKKK